MGTAAKATTGAEEHLVLAAYEHIVGLSTSVLAAEVAEMREAFQRRTGAFGPEDPWFEARSRAFWDDALTTQGLATLALPHIGADMARVVAPFRRAHRGIFLALGVEVRGVVCLLDLWSGAELLVRPLDEAQTVTFEHAEGPMDARVVAGTEGLLFVLPGVVHHGLDALEPLRHVLEAGRASNLPGPEVLDATLRMERVFRTSSRVKAAFAYRVESLSRPRAR